MKPKNMSLLRSLANISLISIVCAAAGCSSAKEKEKPLLSRGWVGGQVTVVKDFPKAMIPCPKSAILLTALATNTPAALAGLREGDLILALDHQPVENLRQLRRKIDPLNPGSPLPVTVFRDGQIHDYTVTVGEEKYRRAGSIAIFFPAIFHQWSIWPSGDRPTLSAAALGYQINRVNRLELGSAERQYHLKCNPKDTPYAEDYKIWLAIVEFSKGKEIAGQQLAESAK